MFLNWLIEYNLHDLVAKVLVQNVLYLLGVSLILYYSNNIQMLNKMDEYKDENIRIVMRQTI